MRLRKSLIGTALGSILIIGTAGFAGAAPQQRWARGSERQEQIARDEIRRGELMEQQGRRLESRGDWRRGETLERQGESLERHGRQLLRQTEWREHEGLEYHR
jgi:hypothetical protein